MRTDCANRRILILGGTFGQIPMIDAAHRLGMFAIVCDRDANAYARTYADLFYPVDFSDLKALADVVRCQRVDGVATIGTNQAIYWAARLREEMSLPTLLDPSDRLMTAICKDSWRAVFEEHGVPVAPGCSGHDLANTLAECRRILALPLVTKPSDGSGGKGIRIVTRWEGFPEAFRESNRLSVSGKVIVESFLGGTVIGVESFVADGRITTVGIAEKQMSPLPHFITLGVIAPSTLTQDVERLVLAANTRAIESLNLHYGAVHIDMVVVDDLPYIIDVGSRLAGGPIIFEIIRECYGVCMIEATLRQAVGLDANLAPQVPLVHKGSRHWPAPSTGIVKNVEVPLALMSEMDVTYFRIWKHPGDRVRKAENDTDILASVVIRASSFEETLNRLDYFMEAVRFDIEPDE